MNRDEIGRPLQHKAERYRSERELQNSGKFSDAGVRRRVAGNFGGCEAPLSVRSAGFGQEVFIVTS
jgi:hypothetical protein